MSAGQEQELTQARRARILRDVSLAAHKPDNLTPAESEWWDKMEEQVSQHREHGMANDIPPDLEE